MPLIVDSSGWIEYFTGGANADHFAPAIEDTENLIVPSIILTEVSRWMYREATESNALAVAASMRQAKVVSLDDELSVYAAEVSHRYKLPLADGIIYATSLHYECELMTQDADMEGLPGVIYLRHPKRN